MKRFHTFDSSNTKTMTFILDTENQFDNFYLVYKNNLLFAKCDIEDMTIRFYDQQTDASISDLEDIIFKMRKLQSEL